MQYSYTIEQAIRAASILHNGQVRKGKTPYPYVSHVISVACIVSTYTDNEDIVVAALLHDTLEDTDYRPEDLSNDFGLNVRLLVESVSEWIRSEEEHPPEWKERKKRYLANIQQAEHDALFIVGADKIHNLRSAIEDYYEDLEGFRRDFGGSLRDRITVYQSISNILNRRLKSDMVGEFNHVFTEYKNFVAHVEKSLN